LRPVGARCTLRAEAGAWWPLDDPMLTTRTTTQEHPWGQVTTRHLEGAIVETVYTGHCSRFLVQSVLDITPEVLREVPGTSWLVELSGATTVEADARAPGPGILKHFKDHGGHLFAVVTTRSALRFIFSAVALAVGLPVKMFASREEALEFLRKHIRGADAAQ
jgi:hypothetical protein